jgi:eukaryotic-like serine/threonine-protein kinase
MVAISLQSDFLAALISPLQPRTMLDSCYSAAANLFDVVRPVSLPSRLDPFGGRFTDVVRIGGGFISDVYRCFDNELSREVALKCLNPITGRRQEDRERFIREPLMMEMMDHPSIPHIYGRFREHEPAPFFTMECLAGTDLCRILSQLRINDPVATAAFPLKRLVGLLADACEGFSVAHDQEILHRDIKPENLMIDVDGQIHIIDWGVAKAPSGMESPNGNLYHYHEIDRRQNPRLTRAGQQPGTLLYMSPEQVVGLSQLDPRSDIYSLGAVLYDCLALDTFIQGDSFEENVNRITLGPQIPPSQRTLRPSVPSSIEAVCMRALCIDPRDRFDTMQQFREAMLNCCV